MRKRMSALSITASFEHRRDLQTSVTPRLEYFRFYFREHLANHGRGYQLNKGSSILGALLPHDAVP